MTTCVKKVSVLLFLASLGIAQGVHAQTTPSYVRWQGSTETPGNWMVEENWNPAVIPSEQFDEVAVISNGATAIVDSVVSPSPSSVLLGENPGETGHLIIKSGGALATGNVELGEKTSNIASLTVEAGASLVVVESIGGEAKPANLTFGGATGGPTTITADAILSNSFTIRVIGPNVNLTCATAFFSGGTYIPEITADTHSTLVVTDFAIVAAKLRPEFSNGFVPELGDQWTIVTAPFVIESFTSIDTAGYALPANLAYDFTFDPDPETSMFVGVLSIISAPPMPDLNMDGVVDIFDVNIVSDNWGTAGPAGDANKDGIVDIFDVNVISDNWSPSGSAVAVPEPASGALVLLAAAALAAVRIGRLVR